VIIDLLLYFSRSVIMTIRSLRMRLDVRGMREPQMRHSYKPF